jgi:hypothetical protein
LPEAGAPSSRPALALALVLLVGLGFRFLASLAPDCIPGWDGAYYFVQVRGLLREGRLPFPDLPLLYWALAALARILSTAMAPGAAIEAAVRWTDALLPLALAIPVYHFAWPSPGKNPSRAALAIFLVGLIAVASGNVLLMAGDMIKNGAALPFSLFYFHFLHRFLREGGRRWALLALLSFLVSSLIHISALALNAAFSVCFALLALFRADARISVGLLAGVGLAIASVPTLDPDRGGRLIAVLRQPSGFFSSGWLANLERPELWLGNALGLLGVAALWLCRKELDRPTRILLGAATLTTLAFCFPLLRPDLLERLALVSFVAGLIPATYLARRSSLGAALVAPLTALTMLHGVLAVKTHRVTGLVATARTDLERMKPALPPGRNLVMVNHGLRWWTTWILETHFCNGASRALADRKSYDAVLLLEEVHPGAFGSFPSKLATTPGATLRDGRLLQGESFTVLREGEYFRLSRLADRIPAQP